MRTPVYTNRIDIVSSSLIYTGEAAVGSADSDAVWRITQINIAGNSISMKFVDGNSDADSVWADRASYTYI